MRGKSPFFWLRRISPQIQALDQIPLFGSAPEFDYEKASSLLSDRLSASVKLNVRSQKYRTADEVKEGLGSDAVVIPLKVAPFDGSAYWICPHQTMITLTEPIPEDLAEGYYRYLLLQAMDVFSTVDPLQNFSFTISESTPLPETEGFCIDLEMNWNHHNTWGRLVIDPELLRSTREFFLPGYLPLSSQMKVADVTIGIKVGSTRLARDEWDQLKPGDFLLLDAGSYDPRKSTGVAYLMLETAPIFQVKVKQNKIQLIDHAMIHEAPMTENNPSEENTFQAEAEQLPPAEESSTSLSNIPVDLTVELARYKITLEKLMELAPGNLIELPIHPEQAVKLTIGGKLVGHAELVHLGEHLGIRIIDLG